MITGEETQKDVNIVMNEIQKILDESLGFYVQLQTTTSELTNTHRQACGFPRLTFYDKSASF